MRGASSSQGSPLHAAGDKSRLSLGSLAGVQSLEPWDAQGLCEAGTLLYDLWLLQPGTNLFRPIGGNNKLPTKDDLP